MTPLHKGGDLDDVSNFRPISVLPVLSKIIERHTHDALYGYLTDNNLIYPRQSGFRKRHSTETALIQIIDELLFNLDKNKISGLVLVDYSKAFDMVDHIILLDKLIAYGVDGSSLLWFKSYLSDRCQLVSLAGTKSDMATVRHGVPQGSILGPLLFILFINDLPLHVSSSTIDLYADDTTITSFADCGNMLKLQDSLNSSVSEVVNWASANKLPLNEKKTKVLVVTGKRLMDKMDCVPEVSVKDTQLTNVPSAKLLGLEIDHEVSFLLHVDNICKKLSQRIGILRKIRKSLPLKQRLTYYNSVIKPIIDYVNVIWTTCDKESLGRVLKLQKRAARVILNADLLAPSVTLFNRLKWLPFYEDAKITRCSIAYKRLRGDLPSYLTDSLRLNSNLHRRNTRYSNYNLVCPLYKRQTEGGRTFGVLTSKLWNSLPLNMRKHESLNSFKNALWLVCFVFLM